MVAMIEMFGMPGAGKTTLAKAVSQFLPGCTTSDLSRAWAARSHVHRGLHIARALLNLRCVAAAAELVIRAGISNREGLFRMARLVAKTHWIRSQPRTMLLDQGFLQDLWSILYCAGRLDPDPKFLVRLIRSLYSGVDARIFYLEMDADTASFRIRGRSNGASRFDGLQQVAVRSSLTCAAELDRAVISAAVKAGLNVVTLNGATPVAVLGEQMLAALEADAFELRHTRPHPA